MEIPAFLSLSLSLYIYIYPEYIDTNNFGEHYINQPEQRDSITELANKEDTVYNTLTKL